MRADIHFLLDKYFPVRKSWQVRNWRSACHNHACVCTLMNAEPDPFPNLPSVMKRREGFPLQDCLVSQVNTHAYHPCDLQIGFAIKLFTNLYLHKNASKTGCCIVWPDMLFAFKVLAVLQGVAGCGWVWQGLVHDTGGSEGTQRAEM